MGYISTDKLSRLAGVSFRNGIRLHFDSIKLFKQDSYASALQLSILAQEEIGKAFLLEETVFRTWSHEWSEEYQKDAVELALSRHRVKQGWFNRFANDFITHHHGRWISRFTTDIITGKLENKKQDSAYAGLTRIPGQSKTNLLGKIIDPLNTKPDEAKRQITRVNDLLMVYSDGFSRGVFGTDIYYIAEQMTHELVTELRKEWKYSSRYAISELSRLKKVPLAANPLSDWDEDL